MAPAEAVQVRLICDDETAVAARPVGAAGATVIPDWVPVMPEDVSVTVSDCVPSGLERDGEGLLALIGARELDVSPAGWPPCRCW